MVLFKSKSSQKGQILLIVVLAAVVSLTVGLSAVSRTITNTSVTTEEANSQKALSAAEAGVEQLIKQDNPVTLANNLSNNSGFNATADPVDGGQFLINGGGEILKDDGADIWLTNYPDFSGSRWTGTLSILWNNNDGCSVTGNQKANAAVEIVVISGDRNSPDMSRAAYDSCSRGNGFQNPNLGAGERTVVENGVTTVFDQGFNVNITDGYIARVIPLYGGATMGVRVQSGSGLPPQGYIIDSVGTSGNTKRSVRVFKGYPKIPVEYFPYNLFLP